VTISQAKTPSV